MQVLCACQGARGSLVRPGPQTPRLNWHWNERVQDQTSAADPSRNRVVRSALPPGMTLYQRVCWSGHASVEAGAEHFVRFCHWPKTHPILCRGSPHLVAIPGVLATRPKRIISGQLEGDRSYCKQRPLI